MIPIRYYPKMINNSDIKMYVFIKAIDPKVWKMPHNESM